MSTRTISTAPAAIDSFIPRHLGPSTAEQQAMLAALGYDSLDAFIDAVVPESIRFRGTLATGAERSEAEVLGALKTIASSNAVYRSFIGMGYYGTHTPNVILRNVMENPAWYTAYTPYQAEIAQGRLEALLNYQTMVVDLTGLEIANASLLDEGTAAAEAMALAFGSRGSATRNVFLVGSDCHPQTIAVVEARASARGIAVQVGDPRTFEIRRYRTQDWRLTDTWRVNGALRTIGDAEWDSLQQSTIPRNAGAASRARLPRIENPRVFPGFSALRVDPQARIWLNVYFEPRNWLVIDRDGTRLSRVSLPYAAEARPQLIGFVRGGVAISHVDDDGAVRLSVHEIRGDTLTAPRDRNFNRG